MGNLFKSLAAAAIVGVAATAAWAVIAPTVIVNAPSSVKVGSVWNAHVVAVNPAPMPPGTTVTLFVTVTEMARSGNGNGRTTMVFDAADNHALVTVDIPVRASGWASGALVVAESVTMGPDGTASTTETHMVTYTTGSGSPK